jgi:hypothetical protein
MSAIIGIDPGLKGGVALYVDGKMHAEPLPVTLDARGKNIVDISGLVFAVNAMASDKIYIESPFTRIGERTKGALNSGIEYGRILGAFQSIGITPIEIKSQTWQKFLYRGIPGKGKERSIIACRRLYPHIDLFPGKKRVAHDGMADAVLICEYGRLRENAKQENVISGKND